MSARGLLALLLASSAACSPTPPAPPPDASAVSVLVTGSAVATAEAPPRPAVPEDPVLKPEAIFVAEPAKTFTRRAAFARAPNFRFKKGAKEASGQVPEDLEPFPYEEIVLENGPQAIRLLLDALSVRLAVYVDAKDALELPTREIELRIEGVTGAKDGLVVLRPGAPITASASAASERRVKLMTSGVELSGWLPADALGRVFTPADGKESTPTHAIERRVEVLTGPKGTTLAVVRGEEDDPQPVQVAGEVRDGFQRIVIDEPRFRIEGWVPTSSLSEWRGLGGFGTGHGGGWGGTSMLRLKAGTKLHASADGEQVGVLTADVTVSGGSFGGPWNEVGVHFPPWDFVRVWVDAAATQAARDEKKAQERRRARVTVAKAQASAGYEDPRRHFELTREEVAECIEAAEAQGKPLAGEITVIVTLTGIKVDKSVASGPLVTKNKALKECVEKEVRPPGRHVPGGPAPKGGKLEVTYKIDAPK
jgi:hypothetical protein